MEQNEMMNGMPRREQGVMYKRTYNCCQSVLLAFAPELGLPEEKLLAMGACFGSGMGSMDETCGALCGAQMAQGLLKFDNRRMNGMWESTGQLLDAVAMHPGVRRVDRKGVAKFREAGYGVNVWTVNSVKKARKLAEWGVTGVFTDRAQDFPEAWRA